MRLSSGVPRFDALVQGGIPSGAAVVIQGPAGWEKDTFLFQFVAAGPCHVGAVPVVLSSESPVRRVERREDAGLHLPLALTKDRMETHSRGPSVHRDGADSIISLANHTGPLMTGHVRWVSVSRRTSGAAPAPLSALDTAPRGHGLTIGEEVPA